MNIQETTRLNEQETPHLEEIWEEYNYWKITIQDKVYYFHTLDLSICQ